MKLYDETTGRQLISETQLDWTLRLKALYDDMLAAGASPAEAAYLIVEDITCLRCDETMRRTFCNKRM